MKNRRKRSMVAQIQKAVQALKKKPVADRLQLMVKAKVLTPEQAEQAQKKLNGKRTKR